MVCVTDKCLFKVNEQKIRSGRLLKKNRFLFFSNWSKIVTLNVSKLVLNSDFLSTRDLDRVTSIWNIFPWPSPTNEQTEKRQTTSAIIFIVPRIA